MSQAKRPSTENRDQTFDSVAMWDSDYKRTKEMLQIQPWTFCGEFSVCDQHVCDGKNLLSCCLYTSFCEKVVDKSFHLFTNTHAMLRNICCFAWMTCICGERKGVCGGIYDDDSKVCLCCNEWDFFSDCCCIATFGLGCFFLPCKCIASCVNPEPSPIKITETTSPKSQKSSISTNSISNVSNIHKASVFAEPKSPKKNLTSSARRETKFTELNLQSSGNGALIATRKEEAAVILGDVGSSTLLAKRLASAKSDFESSIEMPNDAYLQKMNMKQFDDMTDEEFKETQLNGIFREKQKESFFRPSHAELEITNILNALNSE